MISISKAEHLPSFWNRGPGQLENGISWFLPDSLRQFDSFFKQTSLCTNRHLLGRRSGLDAWTVKLEQPVSWRLYASMLVLLPRFLTELGPWELGLSIYFRSLTFWHINQTFSLVGKELLLVARAHFVVITKMFESLPVSWIIEATHSTKKAKQMHYNTLKCM